MIYKFETTKITVPLGSKLLKIAVIDGITTSWVLIGEDKESYVTISIYYVGTGQDHVPPGGYFDTIFDRNYVWHYFVEYKYD